MGTPPVGMDKTLLHFSIASDEGFNGVRDGKGRKTGRLARLMGSAVRYCLKVPTRDYWTTTHSRGQSGYHQHTLELVTTSLSTSMWQ